MYTITSANVTVMVKDMDASVEFYKSLGLELKQRWGNHYAQVAAPGGIIGLHPANHTDNSNQTISIGFVVDDLESAKSKLAELNVSFQMQQDQGGDIVNFSDRDGTPLYFMKLK